MKKRKELDVDFIGGQGPLTKRGGKGYLGLYQITKDKKKSDFKKSIDT